MYSAQPFTIPPGMSLSEQIAYCKGIIHKLRAETMLLRKETLLATGKISRLEKEIEKWKRKIDELTIGNQKLREERDRLKKEEERLRKEVEKLTKTNNRYQIALFDHGNFTHPEHKHKKKKGGQAGHTDTNREARVDYSLWPRKRLFGKTCGNCGKKLSRVNAFRQKILLDIVIQPELVKLILESERQWCGNCQNEVHVYDNRCLPFTEYGINTFMMVMILRFKGHASFSSITTIMGISHGLFLSKSDVSNILKAAGKYLGKRYEALKTAIRSGSILYQDETGWLIHGQKAWMWIMANEEATVYFAAESRGRGIAEELYGNSQAYAMTDGLKSYQNAFPQDKHMYCWSHVLRFAFEETIYSKKGSAAVLLREELVRVYRLQKSHPEYTKKKLKELLRHELQLLLSLTSKEESFINIQRRLRDQQEGLIQALLVTPDGTNNLAERELRNMALKRSISHGSDTYQGMETTAVIGSVLQTLHRNKQLPFFLTLQSYMTLGIQEKQQQFTHTAYHHL
jgi:transposase